MSRMLLLSLLLLTCRFSLGQEATLSGSANQKQLLKLQSELIEAENNPDAAVFDKLVAEDWVNANSTGQPGLTKKEVLQELRQPKPDKVSAKDTATHVFGDTGVLTFTKEYANDAGDVHLEHVVDVFTRDREGWKLRFSETH